MVNIDYLDNCPGYSPPEYCAALVNVYPLKDKGIPHAIYRIIKVIRPQIPTVKNPQVLKGRRFYGLLAVLYSAYVVLVLHDIKPKPLDVFYINNYIDWDQYQVLYEEDWEEKGYQRARKIKRQHNLAKKAIAGRNRQI